MSDDTPPVVLNANQRRHFEVLFARLEDSLARVDGLLHNAPAREPVLSIIEDDLREEYRAFAEPALAGLRDRIAQMARALGLHPRRVSKSRTIAATLSAEAIRFEDSRASKLRGYGDVDPSVGQRLDPVLEEIARTLNELAAAIRSRGRAPRVP